MQSLFEVGRALPRADILARLQSIDHQNRIASSYLLLYAANGGQEVGAEVEKFILREERSITGTRAMAAVLIANGESGLKKLEAAIVAKRSWDELDNLVIAINILVGKEMFPREPAAKFLKRAIQLDWEGERATIVRSRAERILAKLQSSKTSEE